MSEMITTTYHNDPEFKQRCVEAARHHAEIDRLRAGTYGKMNGVFHGCSVGCDAYDITGDVVNDNPHMTTAEYFGFPAWLEYLRDQIFEGLPYAERNQFHVRLKEAVPVGVDLEPVLHKLAVRRLDRLIETQTGVLQKARNGYGLHDALRKVIAAMQQVRSCHEAEIRQGHCTVSLSAWSVDAAARSARSAAESAESAASRSAAYRQEADDLIALLEDAS